MADLKIQEATNLPVFSNNLTKRIREEDELSPLEKRRKTEKSEETNILSKWEEYREVMAQAMETMRQAEQSTDRELQDELKSALVRLEKNMNSQAYKLFIVMGGAVAKSAGGAVAGKMGKLLEGAGSVAEQGGQIYRQFGDADIAMIQGETERLKHLIQECAQRRSNTTQDSNTAQHAADQAFLRGVSAMAGSVEVRA